MINIEIDGKQVSVPKGGTVMDGARKLGIYIPHFCYHKKLSIAANCRMCLVQVEKAPKPLPACATFAAEGMKVFSHSEQATTAQKGVMEFLLINHPLDCPICDQGGECQLQDLAVGYGASASRYEESKRVVVNKNLGPLISTDMTRCIHCTRCVRFGQEIADVMELGMAGRGEHAEILSFVGSTVNSELSGNMIDLCPVGALVSKPFRYSARTWELSRRKSISPHCGLGSNLVVQVKKNKVMRVLPRENEEINECWLSDKDRFSYEGLNSEDRLTMPMINNNGVWEECEWKTALKFIANKLKEIKENFGSQSIGALASPHSTVEELYLLQKLIRSMGSQNIDHRLRQSDFNSDRFMNGSPWLGMNIADISKLKTILIIGSSLRKDHPLIAQRIRRAVKDGAELSLINPVKDDLLTNVTNQMIVPPSKIVLVLAQVLKVIVELKQEIIPENIKNLLEGITDITDTSRSIAESLISKNPSSVFLGNLAQHHPQYADIHLLTQYISDLTESGFGILGEAANSVGAYLAGAVPIKDSSETESGNGYNAAQMLGIDLAVSTDIFCRAFLLLNLEPEFDTYNPQAATKALNRADLVVMMSAYKRHISADADYTDVILPISPFTETSGTFINTEGRVQNFNGVVTPLGETRPGWKVLRVLGNLLKLEGFDFENSEQVYAEAVPPDSDVKKSLSNKLSNFSINKIKQESNIIQRIAEVPIYQADPIVRRAESLQLTHDAIKEPVAWMSGNLLEKFGLYAGDKAELKQDEGNVFLKVDCDDSIPPDCIRLVTAHQMTSGLGGMFDGISVKKYDESS